MIIIIFFQSNVSFGHVKEKSQGDVSTKQNGQYMLPKSLVNGGVCVGGML